MVVIRLYLFYYLSPRRCFYNYHISLLFMKNHSPRENVFEKTLHLYILECILYYFFLVQKIIYFSLQNLLLFERVYFLFWEGKQIIYLFLYLTLLKMLLLKVKKNVNVSLNGEHPLERNKLNGAMATKQVYDKKNTCTLSVPLKMTHFPFQFVPTKMTHY